MLPGAKPGAPFAEPCPAGAREVTYNVSVIQTDIVYNERGDHDTQGRIMVLTEDVDEVLAGTKKPEPLYIRVNAGDCINFNLTNHLPELVRRRRLRPAGPDQHGRRAHPPGQVRRARLRRLLERLELPAGRLLRRAGPSSTRRSLPAAPAGQSAPNCNWNGCRITEEPADWDPNNENSGQIPPGQTISERWYADTELQDGLHPRPPLRGPRPEPRLLRRHDRRAQEHGLPQPEDRRVLPARQRQRRRARAPTAATACAGTAAGAAMDIIGPGTSDDFREFGLAIQDFVSLTKAGGDSANRDDVINAPAAPEEFPDADPGTMAINYRNAPFQYRESGPGGSPSDPAHVFSSTVHGDPMTPILQTYAERPGQGARDPGLPGGAARDDDERHPLARGARRPELAARQRQDDRHLRGLQLRGPEAELRGGRRPRAPATTSTAAPQPTTCTWAPGASCGPAPSRSPRCSRCRTTTRRRRTRSVPGESVQTGVGHLVGAARGHLARQPLPDGRARSRPSTWSRCRPSSTTTRRATTTPTAWSTPWPRTRPPSAPARWSPSRWCCGPTRATASGCA